MYVLFEEGGKFLAGRVLSQAEASLQVELDSGKRVKLKSALSLLQFEKPTPAELLTQGAAMAAEDGYVLASEMLSEDGPLEARLMRYSQMRYARCAFVHAFSRQWMEDEQAVRTAEDLAAARAELALNASARIAASDRILNTRIF